jgi:hypothetical protein
MRREREGDGRIDTLDVISSSAAWVAQAIHAGIYLPHPLVQLNVQKEFKFHLGREEGQGVLQVA